MQAEERKFREINQNKKNDFYYQKKNKNKKFQNVWTKKSKKENPNKNQILNINLKGEILFMENLNKIQKEMFYKKIDEYLNSDKFNEENKTVIWLAVLEKLKKFPRLFSPEIYRKKNETLVNIIMNKNF